MSQANLLGPKSFLGGFLGSQVLKDTRGYQGSSRVLKGPRNSRGPYKIPSRS